MVRHGSRAKARSYYARRRSRRTSLTEMRNTPKHDRAPSEACGEVVSVHTHPHPLELASKFLEDSARPRIGERLVEQLPPGDSRTCPPRPCAEPARTSPANPKAPAAHPAAAPPNLRTVR